MNKWIIGIGIVFSIAILAVFVRTKEPLKEITKEEENRAETARGRFEYEFNLVRSPKTGEIPEGIHDQEIELLKNAPVRKRKKAPSVILRGPTNMSGRIRTLAFDMTDPTYQTMFTGGVSSGVFRSTDGGQDWQRVSPQEALHHVTTIVQDPSQPNIWYYGTGEIWSFHNPIELFGDGIWKSIDNGLTWAHLESTASLNAHAPYDGSFDAVYRLTVHPQTGHLYAAVQGKILRSTDQGLTWEFLVNLNYQYGSRGVSDILISPSGDHFFAAVSGESDISTQGVWYSTTGNPGDWRRIAGDGSNQTPDGWPGRFKYGRIVLGWSEMDSSLLIFYDNDHENTCEEDSEIRPEGDVFRFSTIDQSWEKLTLRESGPCVQYVTPLSVQDGYDMMITASPVDPDLILVGGTNLYRTTDSFLSEMDRIGGYSLETNDDIMPGHHPDQHYCVFDPINPDVVYSCSDGGLYKTNVRDEVPTWESLNHNLVTFQYYFVALSPFYGSSLVMGGAQDNGTTITESGSVQTRLFGGDGVACGIGGELNDEILYFGAQLGLIYKTNLRSDNAKIEYIKPIQAAEDTGLFITNFLLDPNNRDNLYYMNTARLYRNTHAKTARQDNWTELTGLSGLLNDDWLFSMAVSGGQYSSNSKLLVGTIGAYHYSGGQLFVFDDPANMDPQTVPREITPPGKIGGTLSSISMDPQNADMILVTYSNYDKEGNIQLSRDGGETWENIEGNLSVPSIRSSAVINRNGELEFFVGTTIGLWSTTFPNGSATEWKWESLLDMKSPVVSSLSYRQSDQQLLVGTYGNGMYQISLGKSEPIFSTKAYQNHVPYADLSDTSDCMLHVLNPNLESSNSIDIYVYGKDGQFVGALAESRLLAPGEMASWSMADHFGHPSDPLWVQVGSDKTIVSYVEQKTPHSLSSYYASPLADEVFLPHIAKNTAQFETLLSVVNATPEEADPTLLRMPQNDSYTLQGPQNPFGLFSDPITTILGSDLAGGPDIWGVVQNHSPQIAAMEEFSRLPEKTQRAALSLNGHAGKNLRFLHVAVDTNQFWTGMVIINTGNEESHLTEIYYDSNGEILKTENPVLGIGEKRTLLYDYAHQVDVPVGTSWIDVQSDQFLIGYELFGSPDISSNDNFVGLQSDGQSSNSLIFPHFVSTEQMYSGIVLVNTGEGLSNVSLAVFDNSGKQIEEKLILDFPPKTKRAYLLADLFNEKTHEEGAWLLVKVEGSEFSGFQIWGDHNVPERDFLAGIRAVVSP